MEPTTITVDEQTLARFKSLKAELDEAQPDVHDHSADSFLPALLDTWEAAEDGYYEEPSADAIADQLRQEIDSLAVNGAVHDEEAEQIIRRIDDLESQLPRKVAEELQR